MLDQAPRELGTSRLRLRPASLNDADCLFAVYADPAVSFFMLPNAATREQVEQSLLPLGEWRDQPRFVIVHNDEVIGEVLLEVDWADGTANLAYALARDWWGKGFATEAAQAVIDYGFGVLGLAKIYARADPRNIGSVRVMEKLGLQKEAHLRSHVVRRGERCDRVIYGLLRREWNNRQHAMPEPGTAAAEEAGGSARFEPRDQPNALQHEPSS